MWEVCKILLVGKEILSKSTYDLFRKELKSGSSKLTKSPICRYEQWESATGGATL